MNKISLGDVVLYNPVGSFDSSYIVTDVSKTKAVIVGSNNQFKIVDKKDLVVSFSWSSHFKQP